jgi:hypothetical protein
MQRRPLLATLALGGFLTGTAAQAGPADDVRDLYGRFLAAQNAHDLEGVRALLWDSPRFLWVSDGRSFWGPDALVERMAQFQKAPVWRVEPELDAAVPVELDATTAYLHLPLTLVIGSVESPDRLPWLVSMLGVRTDRGWRIAALLTTVDKRPAAGSPR